MWKWTYIPLVYRYLERDLKLRNYFLSVHLHTQRQTRVAPQNAATMTCPCSPCQHDPQPSTPNAYTNKTYQRGGGRGNGAAGKQGAKC